MVFASDAPFKAVEMTDPIHPKDCRM